MLEWTDGWNLTSQMMDWVKKDHIIHSREISWMLGVSNQIRKPVCFWVLLFFSFCFLDLWGMEQRGVVRSLRP